MINSYLDQVGIPGILTDVQVVVAALLLCWLSKDVSCVSWISGGLPEVLRSYDGASSRYFDARTKRPDICAHVECVPALDDMGVLGKWMIL